MSENDWKQVEELTSLEYTCGFCNKEVASQKGYSGPANVELDECMIEPREPFTAHCSYIYFCRNCNKPSLFEILEAEYSDGPSIEWQFPEPKASSIRVIEGLQGEVKTAYGEAHKCFTAKAWTATAMLCRKMLMNISVSEKALEGKGFVYYVDYLSENGHLTLHMKEWAERVKKIGNEANHKIIKTNRHDAKDIFNFIQFLLIITYELPHKARQWQKIESAKTRENKS